MVRIRTVWVALLATCAFGVGSCQSASPAPVGLRVLLRLAPDAATQLPPADTAAATVPASESMAGALGWGWLLALAVAVWAVSRSHREA